jgi:hypothetical protein
MNAIAGLRDEQMWKRLESPSVGSLTGKKDHDRSDHW